MTVIVAHPVIVVAPLIVAELLNGNDNVAVLDAWTLTDRSASSASLTARDHGRRTRVVVECRTTNGLKQTSGESVDA